MTSMLGRVRTSLGWSASLGLKFFKVTPLSTVAVQFSTLVSQLLLVMAFFLPLKVVFLLGASSVPQYFPAYLRGFHREQLIIAISVAALLCYAAHLLLEGLIKLLSRHGARVLLARSRKIALFENQEKIAASAYSRYVRALAASTFAIISFAALLYIYPILFFFVVGYSFIVFVLVIAICERHEASANYITKNLGACLNALASTGFMFAFFCMVADFLLANHPSVLVAVIALLLIRQGFQRVVGMIQDLVALRGQRRQIGALFFHSQPLIVEQDHVALREHSLLDASRRHQWIDNVLSELTRIRFSELHIVWHQIGAAGVYAFEVEGTLTDTGTRCRYFVKLFGEETSSLAVQEQMLLKAVPSLPALRLLGTSQVQGLHCHVFAWSGERKPIRREVGPAVLDVSSRFMAAHIPDDLLTRFMRSRQPLEYRVERRMVEKLGVAVTSPEQAEELKHFLQAFEHIRGKLAALPRQLTSLDITSDTLLVSSSNEFLLSHWANWRIEPLGAGWPIGERDKLSDVLNKAISFRPELKSALHSSVVLAALMYAFERFCSQRNYQAALALIPEMLPLLDDSQLELEASNG